MKKIILLFSFLIVSIAASAQYSVPQQTSTAMNGDERANLAFAHDFVRDILNAGNLDIATHYMSEDFISHNPNVAGSRDSFIEALRTNPLLIQNVGQTTPEVQFSKPASVMRSALCTSSDTTPQNQNVVVPAFGIDVV